MSVLVDSYSAAVFPVRPEPVLFTSRPTGSCDLLLRPVTPGDNYSVSVWACCEDVALLSVLDGTAAVNGVRCQPGGKSITVHNGSFIELGSSYRLQFKANDKPHPLRTLPRPPPGYQPPPPEQFEDMIEEAELGLSHDSLLWSHDTSVSGSYRRELASGSFSGSVEGAGSMSDELRARLKRIAKEVTSREAGYKDRRPPPPYEQVANSVNYQLLHHKHPRVTKQLIDSLYGALKEMEFKDHDLPRVFNAFLDSYSTARAQSATPTCMMPADLPVVKFALDMLLHIACIPDMTSMVDKVCPIWMTVLVVLATANQNRAELIRVGVASKLLSLMNLTILSEVLEFQELGWAVLGGVVDTQPLPGSKPVILEANLSLVLSLVAKQLNKFGNKLGLVIAILHMLSKLATLARKSVNCDGLNNENLYTPLQASQVLSQLKEADILHSIMQVPPVLRTHPGFHGNYCSLMKAIHPIRLRRAVVSKAPPKPARAKRLRRQTIAISPPDEMGGVQGSPTPYSSWSLPKLPGKRARTATDLIGSSDHVTHPLSNAQATEIKSEENNKPEAIQTAPVSDHVTPAADHVTSSVTITPEVVEPSSGHVISPTINHPLEDPKSPEMISTDQSDCFTFPKSDTLSRDVASLLEAVKAPLPHMALNTRRNSKSHYFRHSVKKRSELQATPTSRMEWGIPQSPQLQSHDQDSALEASSGELSADHALLEEVLSGHNDVTSALTERNQLLGGVLHLWRQDKGLQAMTNLIQASFTEESADLPLFMDALTYFLEHKGPWTLAVCCVLLPTLKTLVTTQRENSCIQTVAMVILSIVERFSDLILSVKIRKTRRRLSERADRGQQLLCYKQLYSIRQSLTARLDLGSDSGVVGTNLRKLQAALKPYKVEIKE